MTRSCSIASRIAASSYQRRLQHQDTSSVLAWLRTTRHAPPSGRGRRWRCGWPAPVPEAAVQQARASACPARRGEEVSLAVERLNRSLSEVSSRCPAPAGAGGASRGCPAATDSPPTPFAARPTTAAAESRAAAAAPPARATRASPRRRRRRRRRRRHLAPCEAPPARPASAWRATASARPAPARARLQRGAGGASGRQ